MKLLSSFAGLVLALPLSAAAGDTIRVGNRDELALALHDPKPGTTISIAPGTYRGGLSGGRLRGTKEEPIVIAGADPKNPPVIHGGGGGLHLSSPEHVELRDLTFAKATGNGINIDDGGSAEAPAHHLVLRNVVVRDVGPDGNRDGIKLSGIVDFELDGCRVERWGSSGSAIDMVGCQRGVISHCTFAEAADNANGVQTKGGSQEIVIRRCRFQNAGGRAINIGGSTGLAFFRGVPGVERSEPPASEVKPANKPSPFEAKNITVEDCEILGSMCAIAFVGVDGALVQHNTIYRPTRWPLRILQENTDERFVKSRNGVFKNNVIVFRASEVREVVNISSNTAPETFEFRGNHWHALDRPADTQRLLNLPAKETDGTYNQAPRFKDAEKGDLSTAGRKRDDAGVRVEE